MRVACYARVARMEQLGIDAQKEYVRDYIKRHPEWELTEEYVDMGVSGDKTDRPALWVMLKEAEEKKFDILVLKSTDRIYRDAVKLAGILQKLSSLGVKVEFVDGTGPTPEQLDFLLKMTHSDIVCKLRDKKWLLYK